MCPLLHIIIFGRFFSIFVPVFLWVAAAPMPTPPCNIYIIATISTTTATTATDTTTTTTTTTKTTTTATTTTKYLAPITDKLGAKISEELAAVADAFEDQRAAKQAAAKAQWELDRVQNMLAKLGSNIEIANLETAADLESALKAAVAEAGTDGFNLTPQEIREIVYKKREAIQAAQDVLDAEENLEAAEASAVQAKADAKQQQQSTITIVVVMVILVLLVAGGAYVYVKKSSQKGGDGASTYESNTDAGAVVAFENPMYAQGGAPLQNQQHRAPKKTKNGGGGGGGGGGFYQDVAPPQEHAGTGYMDVSPTHASQSRGGAAAAAAYVEVRAAADDNDWDSEDEEV